MINLPYLKLLCIEGECKGKEFEFDFSKKKEEEEKKFVQN